VLWLVAQRCCLSGSLMRACQVWTKCGSEHLKVSRVLQGQMAASVTDGHVTSDVDMVILRCSDCQVHMCDM
jgi:hypothetical protein